jgi:membrane-associated protease RseP (regulator of RpoE activity)
MSGTAPFELDALVRSRFEVIDTFAVEDGATEYRIRYVPGQTKAAFKSFFNEIYPKGYLPRLHGSKEDATLLVSKMVAEPKGSPRTPVILLFLTLLSVAVTGLYLSSIYVQIVPERSALSMAFGFSVAVLGILAVHELAHSYVSRRSGNRSTLPYFIPNIPILTGLPIYSFLPTFGAVTLTREAQLDRDSLFDLYFVGPLLGIGVSLVVSVFGVLSSAVLTATEYQSVFGTGSSLVAVNTNFSILQALMMRFTDSLRLTSTSQPGTYYFSSPIDIAAWLGFLITFFSLLPAAPFDGGKMTNMILGERGSRLITGISVVALLLIDTPNYLVVALLIFLLSAMRPSMELLDSISEISSSKKILYVAALLLMVVTIPMPQSIATFPVLRP